MFLVFLRFKKLREAYRKNFHLVAYLKTSAVASYDQKTKKVNELKSNEYFNVSVRLKEHILPINKKLIHST